jgi:small GTP-binding protein
LIIHVHFKSIQSSGAMAASWMDPEDDHRVLRMIRHFSSEKRFRTVLEHSRFPLVRMRATVSVIGEGAVGKTTSAGAMMKIEFTTEYKPTVGASMVKIRYQSPGEPLKWFYIWDTAGMEKYRSLAPVYYRDSTAAMVVYDLSNRQSFTKLTDWLKLYRDTCGSGNPIIIVGNKRDLERAVSSEEAISFAQMLQCEYMEVSAKTGVGIGDILPKLAVLLDSLDSPVRVVSRGPIGSAGCCG